MDLLDSLWTLASTFLPLLVTLALSVSLLMLVSWFLKRRWQNNPDAQFRFQLIMLALSFSAGLALIVVLPISDAVRGQLLSLIGILLSAAIALSSTTFIGNVLAGIMLRVIKSVRPGDFITVADITGRVTVMDLLHTEVQTEDRDLVTVPNIYMISQPMKVVRASGTIVSADVSLGYDVPRRKVAELLSQAALDSGLTDAFVQVRELGDFSIVYRVAGLLAEVKGLISARSQLRGAMLDSLHEAGIEIVSPNVMQTRALTEGGRILPPTERAAPVEPETVLAEEVVFDKANDAASVEALRQSIDGLAAELAALSEIEITDENKKAQVMASRQVLEGEVTRFTRQLKAAEAQLKISE